MARHSRLHAKSFLDVGLTSNILGWVMGSGVFRRDDIIMYVFFSGPAMVVACCFSCSIDDSCVKRKAVAHVCIMMVSFVFLFFFFTQSEGGGKRVVLIQW